MASWLPRRVLISGWKTTTNAWCTASRFGHKKRCCFCQAPSSDNLKHFPSCKGIHSLLARALVYVGDLGTVCAPSHFFMAEGMAPERAARQLIILDGLHRIHSIARRDPDAWSERVLTDHFFERLHTIASHSRRAQSVTRTDFVGASAARASLLEAEQQHAATNAG